MEEQYFKVQIKLSKEGVSVNDCASASSLIRRSFDRVERGRGGIKVDRVEGGPKGAKSRPGRRCFDADSQFLFRNIHPNKKQISKYFVM